MNTACSNGFAHTSACLKHRYPNAQTGSCFMSDSTCDNVCGDGICTGLDTCEVSHR